MKHTVAAESVLMVRNCLQYNGLGVIDENKNKRQYNGNLMTVMASITNIQFFAPHSWLYVAQLLKLTYKSSQVVFPRDC